MQHTDERLEICESQDSASAGKHDKRIGWSEIRPSGGKRTDLPGRRFLKEHSQLSPGPPQQDDGKLLAGQGMERMGDGEAKFPIWVIRCS